MGAPAKFDHSLARLRYLAGETQADLAREFGVTPTAVWFACNPEGKAKSVARVKALQQSHCVVCGAPCVTNKYQASAKGRCRKCYAEVRATTVRPTTLCCQTCHRWKPDRQFPFSRAESPHRRGRHGTCRVCHTEIKRAYRKRTRVPCSMGCGRLANSTDLRPGVKPRCRECYYASVRTA